MMPSRLAVMFGLALLSAPLVAQTQPAENIWRIGVLMAERPGALEALIDGLHELGYVEGRNLILIHRQFARSDQMPALARDLVSLGPHVIVAGHGRAVRALKAVTHTVPIVMANSGDAVAQGLIASLARPGGNVTGYTIMSPELAGKRLAILAEAVPRTRPASLLSTTPRGTPRPAG
jgi:putative ABC transport system substrate-binding protein